jgi:hypothetical protein
LGENNAGDVQKYMGKTWIKKKKKNNGLSSHVQTVPIKAAA